jgi:DNA-binding transcriptional MerR regulator
MNRSSRPDKNEPRKAKAPASDSAGDERGLKIGEAAKVIGVEAYVLRFWETQFHILKPKHARSKHRFYQPRDIETLKLIKRLLHQEGFTIAGANKYIRENGIDPANIDVAAAKASMDNSSKAPPASNSDARRALAEVRRDLESIQKLLGKD